MGYSSEFIFLERSFDANSRMRLYKFRNTTDDRLTSHSIYLKVI